MEYRTDDVGPALRRLRKARGLSQEQVAATMGISRTGPSRYEQPGTNLQISNLLAYLSAIGATLDDLLHELAGGDEADELSEALDEQIRLVNERILHRSGHRRLARSLLERFGGADPPPELRAMADLIDDQDRRIADQDQRIADQDRRLREIEAERRGEDGDSAGGSNGGEAEG